jgi:transcriptional regulator of stress and heat shock response
MIRLSDIIESFIKEMMEESKQKQLEIQRNELANHFSCAPSQINYVLTTRFTASKGYYIESRRGGGGCIIIRKVEHEKHQSLREDLNEKISDSITFDAAAFIITGLYESGFITERELQIMKTVVNDRTISSCIENKNRLRADILKSMIMLILV